MNPHRFSGLSWSLRLGCVVLLASAGAQAGEPISEADGMPRREQRIRVLRFQPGFLADPVNLFPDEPLPEADPTGEVALDCLNVWMGNDNPFTDFRHRGAPGGLGFFRMYGQLQLLDSDSTGFALNVEAVTPAGRQADGVEDGPTVFTPTVAIYHELATGVAVHGFIGTQLSLEGRSGLSGTGRKPVECGVALQHPLFLPDHRDTDGLYFYLGALGRVGEDRDLGHTLGRLPGFEVQPGLHWQLDSRTWLSGAVIVPVQRGYRQEQPFWQVTCQFQF